MLFRLINTSACLGMLLFMILGFVKITQDDKKEIALGVLFYILALVCLYIGFKEKIFEFIGKIF